MDDETTVSTRSGRFPGGPPTLTLIATVAFIGAAALAFAGYRVGSGTEPVLFVEDAVGTVPSTAPPIDSTTQVRSQTDDPDRSDSPSVPDGQSQDERDRGEQGGDEQGEAGPKPRPVELRIDTIDVSEFPIRDVGIEPSGELELPDVEEIGWYRYGATAGRPGATVLAAHVNWNGTLGPFSQLGTVAPGDRIWVTLDDGTTRRYQVTERAVYGKLELPKARIWRTTGAEELVLITCGGDFNPAIRSFDSNIVIYAAPTA